MRTALVAGGTGIIGRRIVEQLLLDGGWNVVAIARRLRNTQDTRWVAVDLQDRAECERKLGVLRDVTHVFYAARHDHIDGALDSVDINTTMFTNVIDAIEPVAKLQHVHAVHGSKYYGQHLGPLPLPLTEDSPRASGRNFYYEQEDLLRARSVGKGWTYSTSRPHILCDAAYDYRRSLGLVIGVYAAIQRELGQPLDFPGNVCGFQVRMPFTDTRLLARGILWMAQEAKCANQAFNIVNGDCVRFADLWPGFARHFGLTTGRPREFLLAEYLSDKGAVWDRVVKRFGLRPVGLGEIAMWAYGDRLFRQKWDFDSAMTTARSLGFDGSLRSADMFSQHFTEYFDTTNARANRQLS